MTRGTRLGPRCLSSLASRVSGHRSLPPASLQSGGAEGLSQQSAAHLSLTKSCLRVCLCLFTNPVRVSTPVGQGLGSPTIPALLPVAPVQLLCPVVMTEEILWPL